MMFATAVLGKLPILQLLLLTNLLNIFLPITIFFYFFFAQKPPVVNYHLLQEWLGQARCSRSIGCCEQADGLPTQPWTRKGRLRLNLGYQVSLALQPSKGDQSKCQDRELLT